MKRTICIITGIIAAAAVYAQTSLLSKTSSDSSSVTQSSSKTSTSSLLPPASAEEEQDATDMTSTSKTATFVPNPQMAMSSSDYLVTPGDIYTLAFAVSTTPITYNISVDTSYKIRVANITVVDATGKTFLQLKRLVEQIVTENYHLSGVQFILTTPAVFNVNVVGEVKKTQTKKAWALSRLSTLLDGAETPYSSERDITITSASGTKKTYDLFKAERFGELSEDPYVRPGDTITVNRITRKVLIDGAVERPGTYELLDGENLKQLVEYYANGLQELADTSRIELTRTLDQEEKPGKKIYLSKDAIDSNYPLVCYDSIFISSYMELKPVMFMEGALYLTTTGTGTGLNKTAASSTAPEGSAHVAVSFQSGENYAFLIRRNSSMFSAVSDIENAYIMRQGKTIPIDVNKILYDASYYSDEIVQPYDTLMIPFKQSFVSVAGSVTTPGRYPYIPGRSWEYYIGLAGGFVMSENTGKAVSIKDIHGNKLSKDDPISPETTITASTNSFTYYFNKYGTVVTTILSALSTSLTVLVLAKQNNLF